MRSFGKEEHWKKPKEIKLFVRCVTEKYPKH